MTSVRVLWLHSDGCAFRSDGPRTLWSRICEYARSRRSYKMWDAGRGTGRPSIGGFSRLAKAVPDWSAKQ